MPSFLCSAPHKQTHAHTHTRTHTQKERKEVEEGDGSNRKTHIHTHTHTHTHTLCPPQGLKELGSILSEQNVDSKEIAV